MAITGAREKFYFTINAIEKEGIIQLKNFI